MTARFIANKHSILVVAAFGACAALAACSTSDGGAKGAAGAAGSGTAGAGTAGAGTAGSGTAGAGTAGAGTAGAGTAGAGMGVTCLPIAASGLVTDFTPVDGGPADQNNFGDQTTVLSGSTFIYQNAAADPTTVYPYTSDVTQGNWHISGTIGSYAGFGFALQKPVAGVTSGCNKIDASAFSGISFKLSGTVAMGGTITLNVGTAGDALADSWFNQLAGVTQQQTFGRCVPTVSPTVAGTTQYSQSDCKDPTFAVTVPATPTTVTVHWTDLMGGKPEASPTASELTFISFNFPAPLNPGMANAMTYMVDITLDDLMFIP